MNNDDIRKAYDRLTPDEETKERMLRAIMARSASVTRYLFSTLYSMRNHSFLNKMDQKRTSPSC